MMIPTETIQPPTLANPKGVDDKQVSVTVVSKSTTIQIPDLFVSFCSRAPALNPFYLKVKAESDEWFAQLYKTTEKEKIKLEKADFALFAAWWSEFAGEAEYRTICDWCNWVFYFDDQFDEGHLCEDHANAQREANILTQIMTTGLKDDEYPEDLPRTRALRFAFRSVWERLAKRASPGVQKRFREAMQAFCEGLVGQVGVRVDVNTRDIESYLAFRRRSIGVVPCIVFAEYYHDLRLPDEVFCHPAIIKVQNLAAEITVLHNDILSYHKEYNMGAIHNIIIILRDQNMTQQEAYNSVDRLIRDRLQAWHYAVADIPMYGEEIDVQIQKYVTACREIAVGNLHWSFGTERYFGKNNHEVRRTREVQLIDLDA